MLQLSSGVAGAKKVGLQASLHSYQEFGNAVVPSQKGERNPPEGAGSPTPSPNPAPLTSLSSLATSFRSPRTNSRSSTMILICSFTLVLEAAGGPSAAEDEEGFPLDLADILRWGEQVRSGQASERRLLRARVPGAAPAAPTPVPPHVDCSAGSRGWLRGALGRAAALWCCHQLPETRRSARGCRRASSAPAPPPAAARRSRAHSRVERGRATPPGAVSCTALGTSCWGLTQNYSEASWCPETSSQVLHPNILIPKGPYHRSLQLLCVFSQPARTPSASPSGQDPAPFLKNYYVIRSWSPSLSSNPKCLSRTREYPETLQSLSW